MGRKHNTHSSSFWLLADFILSATILFPAKSSALNSLTEQEASYRGASIPTSTEYSSDCYCQTLPPPSRPQRGTPLYRPPPHLAPLDPPAPPPQPLDPPNLPNCPTIPLPISPRITPVYAPPPRNLDPSSPPRVIDPSTPPNRPRTPMPSRPPVTIPPYRPPPLALDPSIPPPRTLDPERTPPHSTSPRITPVSRPPPPPLTLNPPTPTSKAPRVTPVHTPPPPPPPALDPSIPPPQIPDPPAPPKSQSAPTPSTTPGCSPTIPILTPIIPTYPIPVPTPPLVPDPTTPFTGSCSYWRSHPAQVWGIFGVWPTISGIFGLPTLPGYGGGLTLLDALSNNRGDGYGALYREGTAALLNSMSNVRFSFTNMQVRERFVAALGSDRDAEAQAHIFKLANEGHN